ncbi:MAG: beta-propeller fold lactonase family protein [Aliidongia sp.]
MSPDGRFLYAGNRLHDTISILALAPDGRARLIGEVSTLADYPRSMGLTPDGRFLVSCNQLGDSLTLFRRDRATGALRFTGDYLPIGSPTVIAFLG